MGQYIVDCGCCSSSSSSSSSSGCPAPDCTDPPSPPAIPSSVVLSFTVTVTSDNTGDSSCLPPCTQDYEITLPWGGSVYEGLGDFSDGPCNDAGIFPHVLSLGLGLDSAGICRWRLSLDMQLYEIADYCTSKFNGPICASPSGSYVLDTTFTLNCPRSNTCNDVVTFSGITVS